MVEIDSCTGGMVGYAGTTAHPGGLVKADDHPPKLERYVGSGGRPVKAKKGAKGVAPQGEMRHK
jgi:hypothetical protein